MNRNLLCFVFLILIFFCVKLPAKRLPHKLIRKSKINLAGTRSYSNSLYKGFADSIQQSWISVYNDSFNGDDEADAMAQDIYGNIYVTGNTSGDLWDITTIKYSPDGTQQWINVFDGPGHGDDIPYDIKVDHRGNTYICGYSDENGEYNYNFLTLKIDSTGNTNWSNLIINLPGPYYDAAFGVAVDDSGNVFSTGATFVTSDFDLTTVKYNSAGIQQWIQRYNSPFNLEDTGEDLVIDSNDNIYITGVSQQAAGNYDVITMKYNTNGVMQWVNRFNGPGDSNDEGVKLSLDPNLNIVVTGAQNGIGTSYDILTIKYDNNGNQLWTSTFNGSGNGNDASKDLAIDEAGNIYITGFATGTDNTSDFATIKYNSSGVQQWVSIYSGPANGFDEANSIALDNSNGVYVTGYSPSAITPYIHYEYATIKYDTSGQEQWVSRYSGTSSLTYEPNVAKAISVDISGSVYVTGEIADEGTGEDFGTIKYSQSIVPVEIISFKALVTENNITITWLTSTETNNRGFEVEKAIKNSKLKIKNWEKIGFVNGNGTTSKPESYNFTDKNVTSGIYSYRLKQIDFNGSYSYSNSIEVNVNVPLKFSLSQNYPNPFNPTTKISWQSSVGSLQTVKVYDVLGREVTTLVNEYKPAGNYEVEFDGMNLPSGIYYYKLQADSFVQTKKMILLK